MYPKDFNGTIDGPNGVVERNIGNIANIRKKRSQLSVPVSRKPAFDYYREYIRKKEREMRKKEREMRKKEREMRKNSKWIKRLEAASADKLDEQKSTSAALPCSSPEWSSDSSSSSSELDSASSSSELDSASSSSDSESDSSSSSSE